MQTKTDLDNMYELMGERWAVVKMLENDEGEILYHISAHPTSYKESEVVVQHLKYSQAKGIKKLLESGGGYD